MDVLLKKLDLHHVPHCELTHHTIAQMIGSSRETVSRTMRNLVDRGIIDVTRREITLKDRRSLMMAVRRS